MMKHTKVLFVGTYLSKKRGTKDIAEKIAPLLKAKGIDIKLVSKIENKFFRLVDVCVQVLLTTKPTVHFDVFSGPNFIIIRVASLFAKIRGRRILFTLRGGKLAEFDSQNEAAVNSVFKRADLIQTPSLFLKSYFENKGYKILYRPNPIDLSKFPYKEATGGSFKILWVRAFTDIYNPSLAVEALAEVVKKMPDAELSMVGPDKGLAGQTKELAKKLGVLDNIEFVGPVPNDELKHYYQSHSIYINTTRYESFGTAVIEAASSGMPIVSTNVGEIPYLWKDGENILLVDNFSPQQMAQQIVRIMGDEALRVKLSKNARANAEQFSWQNIEPGWVELLSKS